MNDYRKTLYHGTGVDLQPATTQRALRAACRGRG